MALTYQTRNLENIAKLAPNTRAAALKWHDYLVANNIDILIYETIRTEARQKELVAQGKSQTMKSYHIVGQALDFVPTNSKKEALWNGYGNAKVKQAIAKAKELGFEWGGDWKSFVDKPHLQFNYKGYGTDKTAASTGSTTSKPGSSVSLPNVTLKKGSKGTDVKTVQNALNKLNFKCGTADGIYGDKTVDACLRFQKMYGVKPYDGIYGTKTRAKMLELL